MTERPTWRVKNPSLWGAVGACVVALFALALLVRDHNYSLYDDPYIYLRHVKNMRAGCGLRFDCTDATIVGTSCTEFSA